MMAEKKECPKCAKLVRFKKDGEPWKHACYPKESVGTTLARLVAARCKPAHQVTVTETEVEAGFQPVLQAGFLQVLSAHPGGTRFEITVHGRCKDCEKVHLLQGAGLLVPRGKSVTAEELFCALAEDLFWKQLD